MNTKRILIVDDDPKIRKTLSDILKAKGYTVIVADTGKAALDMAKKHIPDIVLIDLKLEDMSGLEVMKGIKECWPGTECIVLTGYASQESAIEAVNLGAYSYVQKPYNMEQLLLTIRRAIEKREAQEELRETRDYLENLINHANAPIIVWDPEFRITRINYAFEYLTGYTSEEVIGQKLHMFFSEESQGEPPLSTTPRTFGGEYWESVEVPIIRKDGNTRLILWNSSNIYAEDGSTLLATIAHGTDVTERKRAEEELKRSFKKLRKTLEGTVNALASTVEKSDLYTAGHQERVTKLACAIAKQMGLPKEQIEGIRIASKLHDIGKVHIATEILNKTIKLSEIEMELVKTHAQVGYDILKTVEFSWPVAQIVLQHHERLDGSGYPQGLSGDDILLEAKILTVADVVEAMSSGRPYRPAHDREKAIKEIIKNRDILYDPEVVDICVKFLTEKNFKFD